MVVAENYWGSVVGGLFDALLASCLGCGQATQDATCPSCGAAAQLASTVPSGIVGRWIEARRGLVRRRGLVLDVVADGLEVVQLDGTSEWTRRRRARVLGQPTGIERVRSVPGELLAASQADTLPEPLRRRVWMMAVDQAVASLDGARALAADSVALRVPDVLDQLPLSDTERRWWRGLALWVAGDAGGAVQAMLGLPDGRYPQRLLIWWRAATIPGLLRGAARARVEVAAQGLAGVSPVGAVAATLLLRTLDDGHREASDAALVAATREAIAVAEPESPWHVVVDRWMHGETGEIPQARLLGAIKLGPERLGTEPTVLDAAPIALLDDLLDAASIPDSWIDRADELSCGDYLLARTRITALDDETLRRLGLHDERARRQVLTGDGMPDDVPAPTRTRLEPVAAALDGDDDTLLSLAAGAGLDVHALRRVLEAPELMPPPQLLADQSLAALLVGRSQLDTAELTPEGLDGRQRSFATQVLLRRARSSLYAWEWEEAFGLARECLRFARSEMQRDEALNLIAAAHWQLGNDDAAMRALDGALDDRDDRGDRRDRHGDPSDAALQANMAVVAAELEPRLAAQHLSRLVLEAPNLAMRVQAARQAVLIWGHSDEPWTEGTSLPPDLAEALRALVVEPLDEGDFREVVRILAEHDAEWLASEGVLDGSPHGDSSAARVWIGRARGLEAFVPELAQALRTDTASWAEPLRDQLVTAAIEALAVDDPPVGATGFGVLLITEDLPMASDLKVVLQAFAARGAALGIDPTEAEPAPMFLDWLEEAQVELPAMTGDVGRRVRKAVELGYQSLATSYVVARARQVAQVDDLHELISQQVVQVPRYQRNRAAIRQMVQPGEELCRDTVGLMARLRPHVGGQLQQSIDELVGRCHALMEAFARLYT